MGRSQGKCGLGGARLGSSAHSQLREAWTEMDREEEAVAIESFMCLFFWHQEWPITDLRKCPVSW